MSRLCLLLRSYLDSPKLPEHEALLSLLEGGLSVLEGESPSYRPQDSEGRPGGLLDFTGDEFAGLPVIVVPDLHGRGGFLLDILDLRLGGESVLSLLESGGVLLCCLGDIFHSEGRGRERWRRAFCERARGNIVNVHLAEEMAENLSLLSMILSLKSAFAGHFHILKGNHENVLNEDRRSRWGNVPFRKFCDEGNMVADFLQRYYDDLILHEISLFERALPVCAALRGFLLSHAEPAAFFSRDEIINYHDASSLVTFGLTWTANGSAEEGTAERMFEELLPGGFVRRPYYLTGHRPVPGRYALRQGGRLVQIHNPEVEQVAILLPDKEFDPETDIIDVKKTNNGEKHG